jgi:hypothetical protein
VALAVEEDVAPHPLDVGLSQRCHVAAGAQGVGETVEETGARGRTVGTAGRGRKRGSHGESSGKWTRPLLSPLLYRNPRRRQVRSEHFCAKERRPDNSRAVAAYRLTAMRPWPDNTATGAAYRMRKGAFLETGALL